MPSEQISGVIDHVVFQSEETGFCVLSVKVAGGAETLGNGKGFFATGRRNYHMLRKVLWTNGIMIDAEDVGGGQPRTMHLEIGSGRVWVSSNGETRDL